MMRTLTILAFFALGVSSAEARTHRVDQIPYGSNFGCMSCHTTAAGGGAFTGFGSDSIRALVGDELMQLRDVDWSQLATLDSDRDGFTNGEEVYDPQGLWRIGDPNPIGGVVFNPGDPSSHPLASCGDGRVTPPEECDGTNHRDLTCLGLGMEEGVLSCRPDCTFDRSGCGGDSASGDDDDEPVAEPPTSEVDEEAACSVTGMTSPSLILLLLALVRIRSAFRRTP